MKILTILLVFILMQWIATAASTISVEATYYWPWEHDGTCSGFEITTFKLQAFGTCFRYIVGAQPNCTIYVDCLYGAKSFMQYQDCLDQSPFTVNAFLTPNNETSYFVDIYDVSDTTCAGPLQDRIVVSFGCFAGTLSDTNGTVCNINLTAMQGAASTLDSFLWYFI